MVGKIISGGQTGVDRAALDAALECGMPCGGWCPRGRRAQDGTIPARYPLIETDTRHYAERTARNVRDADATLVLNVGELDGGTAYTVAIARRLAKPCLVVTLEAAPDPHQVGAWLDQHAVQILNVAGPREDKRPGIHRIARAFLRRVLVVDR